MQKKLAFLIAFLALLIIFSYFAVDQNIGGVFRTATPTVTYTATPTITPTYTLTLTATFTFTPTFTSTLTATPTLTASPTPTVTNTLAPLWTPTKKPKHNGESDGNGQPSDPPFVPPPDDPSG